MTLPPTALIALGAIAAAFIAGAVSCVNIIISKDQKTSEFRQKWIDELRDELSQFLSMIDTLTILLEERSMIHSERPMSKPEWISFYQDSIHPEFKEINRLRNKIRLRLNPVKDKELLALLDEIEERFNHIEPEIGNEDFRRIESLVNTALAESQALLKKEWKRVRRGEPSYIVTKYGVLFAFMFVVVLSALVLLEIVNVGAKLGLCA